MGLLCRTLLRKLLTTMTKMIQFALMALGVCANKSSSEALRDLELEINDSDLHKLESIDWNWRALASSPSGDFYANLKLDCDNATKTVSQELAELSVDSPYKPSPWQESLDRLAATLPPAPPVRNDYGWVDRQINAATTIECPTCKGTGEKPRAGGFSIFRSSWWGERKVKKLCPQCNGSKTILALNLD